jgi:glycosyltransferase involved in cell wall biosynthesis
MDACRTSIILNQTVVPDYRLPLFAALRQRYGPRLTVTCGASSPTSGLRSCDRAIEIARLRKNVAILGRQLLWQTGVVEDARRTPLLITEFNMRAASTWAALAERHAQGLPTVLWGHARGRNRALDPLRRWMLRRAEGFIAYTDSQAEAIRRECPWLSVRTAPNAVIWMRDCYSLAGAEGSAWDVLFVGRLIAAKKPLLALHAFADAATRLPRHARLVFVGAGPEATRLESEAIRLGLQGRVHLHGHEADLESLRRIYGQAVVSVSPGYVGLSATQSFAFGVPMLVADGEPHSPEIEACVEGVSARFFASDSPAALASLLVDSFERRDAILRGRKSLAAWTAERYSLDRMMQTFESMIDEFLMAPVSPSLTP